MKSKAFNPDKIGMRICPHCNGYGRKYGTVCSRCGGFGYIKKDGMKLSVSLSISEVSPKRISFSKEESEGGADIESS
jgi:DnaJ-class molecular chaperone